MPTHVTEIFFYDNIYFENGQKDTNQHPVIIAGTDENNIYCFAMTSRTKHTGKNGYSRNIYNQHIKYIATKPGKNCQTYNSIPGLINTTNCITIPKEIAKSYPKFGIASQKLVNDIILRWSYQQNEINDQKDNNYNIKTKALGIDDSIIMSPLYRQLVQLMTNHPIELQNQRTYAKELRIYKEQCTKIRRENLHNYHQGLPLKKYPPKPTLPYDKDYFEQYSTHQLTEEERIKESPFSELSEQLFGFRKITTEQLTNIEQKKEELVKLKNILQQSAQTQTEETHSHSKKAA